MTTSRTASPLEPTGPRRETPEVAAKECPLERLRRQLAAVAKRAARDELGNGCMTTAAIGAPSRRTAGRLGSWLSVRHSLRIEAAAVLTLYGLYELARGLVSADTAEADAHAHRLVALERSLHLFVEANVQRAVQTRYLMMAASTPGHAPNEDRGSHVTRDGRACSFGDIRGRFTLSRCQR
jgi:hypothetical protein